LAAVVFERILYRRLYKATELDQVLLTIGITFMSVAVAGLRIHTAQQPVQLPSYPARLDPVHRPRFCDLPG